MNTYNSIISIIFIFQILIGFINSRERDPLKFHKNHTFTILQITDLHYGEGTGYKKDIKSSNLTEYLIRKTNPDLVAVTGDSVSGYAWDRKDPDWSKHMWQNWTKVFNITKTKYAYTFGNHDSEADFSKEEIFELEMQHPYSYMKRTYDINGFSNYVLPIYSAFGNENTTNNISGLLWFFDTNRQGCKNLNESQTWGCIEEDQIAWYKKESENIKNTYGDKNGLGFFHIPLPEYRDVFNWRLTYGTRNEPVNCPKVNTKMFEEMKKWNNIQATFAGHDHNNDYGGEYDGIELVYGRKTGVGGYGPDFFQRGARLITLTEYYDSNGNIKFKYEHKVIQEDGTFDKQQSKFWYGWNFAWDCVY